MTAQIAAGQKHRAGHFAGVVQQRYLLQSADPHTHLYLPLIVS